MEISRSGTAAKLDSIKKGGITALLAANISKSFNAYCQILHIDEIEEKVPIMLQSGFKTRRGSCYSMDISLFYRFLIKTD